MNTTTRTLEQSRKPAGLTQIAAEALADRLRREISGEVRFDSGSRGLYARDAGNYRQVPIGAGLAAGLALWGFTQWNHRGE